MKVLCTGAFGYFGLALVRHLAERHDVLAVGRAPRPDCAHAVMSALPDNVTVRWFCDVRGLTAGNVPGVEAVVHLAGGGAPGGDLTDAREALRDNVESAVHVADITRGASRRILASSIYVYGQAARPLRECDPIAPDTLYGQLKSVAEACWQQAGGSALRFAHVWGAGSGVDFGRDGVTERLARAAAGGRPFTAHGTGEQQLDLVHIDDACVAVQRALEAEELPAAVNVGGGDGDSRINHLIYCFDRAAGAEIPVARTGSGGAAASRCLSIDLARRALGWAPTVLRIDGARDLIRMVGGAA